MMNYWKPYENIIIIIIITILVSSVQQCRAQICLIDKRGMEFFLIFLFFEFFFNNIIMNIFSIPFAPICIPFFFNYIWIFI